MPSAPVCRPRIQARPKAVRNIGTARMRCSVSIQAPRPAAAAGASAGTKPMRRKGSARPSPSPPNTASAPAAGSTKAAPKAAPMNGPVQGVAMKAASAPVKKAPAAPSRCVSVSPAAQHRQPEQAGEIERDRGDEQQEEQDHARILQLEGPADRRPAGAHGEQQPAEREAGQDHARGISQSLAPRVASRSPRRGRGRAPSG